MNRRHFLMALGGSGTLLGGCIQFPRTGSDGLSKPDEVTAFEFQLGQFDEREPLEEGHVHAADVIVESEVDLPQLHIIGQLASGSRSCKETSLNGLEYDRGRLTVEVLDEHVAGKNEACTTELAVVGCELLIACRDVLPTTLEVTHLGNTSFSETIAVR